MNCFWTGHIASFSIPPMLNGDLELKPNAPEYFDLWLQWRNEPNTRKYNPVKDDPLEELQERRCAFDLIAVQGKGDDVLSIRDPKDRRLDFKFEN